MPPTVICVAVTPGSLQCAAEGGLSLDDEPPHPTATAASTTSAAFTFVNFRTVPIVRIVDKRQHGPFRPVSAGRACARSRYYRAGPPAIFVGIVTATTATSSL